MARLTDEQRKQLQQQLADDDAAAAQEENEPEHYYRFANPDGDSFEVLARSKAGKKSHGWVKAKFGIDLDDEPVQDEEEEPEAKPAARPKPLKSVKDEPKTAFGRRVG